VDIIVYKYKDKIHKITPSCSIELAIRDMPEGAEYKIIQTSELPEDRTFEAVWDYEFKIDISKAKEIWKEKLRAKRIPLFDLNDILIRDGILENDTEKQLAGMKERDRLRDITLLVDDCETLEEIKKITL